MYKIYKTRVNSLNSEAIYTSKKERKIIIKKSQSNEEQRIHYEKQINSNQMVCQIDIMLC